ncbi:hypothetical protein Y032_0226g2780 [Ancylostoma ceylanicum]|uniref:Uncharacterized protein n=1 Tax=Ancylostoma ceylanicum TaxID=53326 RepID=A0A016SGT0_9BILA|nr:hypothetical protein Y032_0226g2780 [Ancylostoma ceylanicum]
MHRSTIITVLNENNSIPTYQILGSKYHGCVVGLQVSVENIPSAKFRSTAEANSSRTVFRVRNQDAVQFHSSACDAFRSALDHLHRVNIRV